MWAWRSPRDAIQSSSDQSYDRSHTFDAVDGGVSACTANGSARSTVAPSRWRTANLYASAWLTPGTNDSQMPEPPRASSQNASDGSQVVESERKPTPAAFGAHTATHAPSVPSTVSRWTPSLSYSRVWLPSLKR